MRVRVSTCMAKRAFIRKGEASFSHPVEVSIMGGSTVTVISPLFSASNSRKNRVRSFPKGMQL